MKGILQAIGKFLVNRTFLIFVMILVMFSIIWASLYRIQILDAEKYKDPIYNNIVQTEEIEGMRGCIYDRYGRLLAGNTITHSLYFSIKTSVPDLNESLYQLLQIAAANGDKISLEQPLPIAYEESRGFYFIPTYDIGYSEIRFYNFLAEVYGTSRAYLTEEQKNATAEEVYYQMRKNTFKLDERYTREEALEILHLRYALFVARAEGKTQLQLIADVSEKTQIEVLERSTDFPGFSVKESYSREYPQGELFAHIIGYMGEISESELKSHENEGYEEGDRIGKTGLEQVFESDLRGTSGTRQIELDGKTGTWVGEEVLVQAVKGNDIFLTIDIEVQKIAYDRLCEQIKSLLLSKITGESSEDNSSYSLSDIYEALIDNNFLSIRQVEESDSTYANSLKEVYQNKSEQFIRQLKTQILTSRTTLSGYSEIMMDIYNVMIENMRDNEYLSYDYQKDQSFYKDYAAGKKTAREFLEYCIDKGYIDKEAYGLGREENIEVILENILEHEISILRRSQEFKKIVYKNIITTGSFSRSNFLRLLYEIGLLSNEDGSLDLVNRGQMSPLECIRKKIEQDEITPAQLNLDPCSGSVVISDPDSGEVLAIVSYPTYDDNLIGNSSYYSKLIQDKSGPLVFRALSELRAPGSTFKLCTSLTALDLGYLDINYRVYDRYAYPNVNSASKPVCWSRVSHGLINVVEAIRHSCNYFFYDVGYRLSDPKSDGSFDDSIGLEKMAEYAKMLGLATKTGIELNEAEPQVSVQDAVRSAIGQGTNAYSAANINRYTCTVANGGTVYNLFLVNRIVQADGKIIKQTEPTVSNVAEISEKNFKIVQEGMRKMVQANSSLQILEENGILTAGKTGTAEEAADRPNHSLFTGYTGYGENPDIVISVVIPFGGGSSKATPVFRNIVLDYYGIKLDT